MLLFIFLKPGLQIFRIYIQEVHIPEDVGKVLIQKLVFPVLHRVPDCIYGHKKTNTPLIVYNIALLQKFKGSHHRIGVYLQLNRELPDGWNPLC